MKIFAVSLVAGFLAFAGPLGAQQKGEAFPTVVICAEQDDALVGASKGAHEGEQALREYLEHPDNSCAFVIPPVLVLFEKEIREISGKAATMRVVEIKSLDNVVTGYTWQRKKDVSL